MKSSVLIISGCLLLGAGVGLGWILRGQSDSAAGKDRLVAAGGAGSADGAGAKAGGAKDGAAGAANGSGPFAKGAQLNFNGPGGKLETPADAARRIMKEMMAGGMEGGPPVELFDFLQSLAACDAPTLNSLIDDVLAQAQAGKENKQGRNRDRGTEMLSMMILARLGTLDPDGAMDRMLEIQKTGGRMDKEIMMFMLGTAAKNDPAKAEAMIARMPDEESKKAAKMAYMMVRAKTDPDGVIADLGEMVKTAAKDSNNDQMFWETRNILRNVGMAAPEKALELAAKFGSAEQQSQMVGDMMVNWAARDPKAAAKWAAESKDPAALKACLDSNPDLLNADSIRQRFASLDTANPGAKAQLAGTLATNLAQSDLQGAVAWSQTLTGADQVAANAKIGRAWVDKDPVAASEWISALPAGSGKDDAVSYLVNRISGDDPESAFVWASSLQGQQRMNSLGRALQGLNAKDPAAADRAINSLPEGERNAARKAMEKPSQPPGGGPQLRGY